MPIYDYRCDECSNTFDIFHKVREVVEDVVCPHCGSAKHTRLLSAPMVMMGKPSSGSAELPSCPDGSCCGGSCGMN